MKENKADGKPGSGSLLTQKTNEDFNKRTPNPADPNQKNENLRLDEKKLKVRKKKANLSNLLSVFAFLSFALLLSSCASIPEEFLSGTGWGIILVIALMVVLVAAYRKAVKK